MTGKMQQEGEKNKRLEGERKKWIRGGKIYAFDTPGRDAQR